MCFLSFPKDRIQGAHVDAGGAPEFQDERLRGHHGGECHAQGLEQAGAVAGLMTLTIYGTHIGILYIYIYRLYYIMLYCSI